MRIDLRDPYGTLKRYHSIFVKNCGQISLSGFIRLAVKKAMEDPEFSTGNGEKEELDTLVKLMEYNSKEKGRMFMRYQWSNCLERIITMLSRGVNLKEIYFFSKSAYYSVKNDMPSIYEKDKPGWDYIGSLDEKRLKLMYYLLLEAFSRGFGLKPAIGKVIVEVTHNKLWEKEARRFKNSYSNYEAIEMENEKRIKARDEHDKN